MYAYISVPSSENTKIHPALLDGVFQCVGRSDDVYAQLSPNTFVPSHIDSVQMAVGVDRVPSSVYAHIKLEKIHLMRVSQI